MPKVILSEVQALALLTAAAKQAQLDAAARGTGQKATRAEREQALRWLQEMQGAATLDSVKIMQRRRGPGRG